MHKQADFGQSTRLQNFAFGTTFAALLFSLTLSTCAPIWSQASSNKPTLPEIEQQAAEARAARRLDEAVKLYRKGLVLKPEWQEGMWYLGTSLYGLKRYEEARDAFHRLVLSQPNNGQAWALAGMCEFELKNYPRALDDLSRSEKAGMRGNEELAYLVRFRIALLLNRAGDPTDALSRLIPIATHGTYPEVIEAIGLSVLRSPMLPSEVPEKDRDLYMKAGEAMKAYVTHDAASAARQFEELVAAYPDTPNVHYARGAFLMENDPAKALPELQRELELNPSHPAALAQMAKLYLEQGSPETALLYAQQAVKATPNAPAPRRILGQALLDSGKTSDAIQELKTAVRLDPGSPQSHFLLAQAYRQAGNKDLAGKEIAEFERLDQKE